MQPCSNLRKDPHLSTKLYEFITNQTLLETYHFIIVKPHVHNLLYSEQAVCVCVWDSLNSRHVHYWNYNKHSLFGCDGVHYILIINNFYGVFFLTTTFVIMKIM